MRPTVVRSIVALALAALVVAVAGCGSGQDDATDERPTVVVTTSILGDVVSGLVGDAAEVVVVMPAGADPHDFQASARDVAAMRSADLLVTNGGGFEQGLADVIEAAEADGVPTVHALDLVDALPFSGEHEDHEEDQHEEDQEGRSDDEQETADDHDHDHDGVDPHFFTDPVRMRIAAEGLAAEIREAVPALATAEVDRSTEATLAGLDEAAADVEATLAPIPADRRVLVTGHEVFGYFADRYDFEIVGVVVPGGGTGGEPSAGELAALAATVEEEGVPAVFVDSSSPDRLADALAAEVGEVEVVDLFTESLGAPGSGGETYVELVRTNAERIAGALGQR